MSRKCSQIDNVFVRHMQMWLLLLFFFLLPFASTLLYNKPVTVWRRRLAAECGVSGATHLKDAWKEMSNRGKPELSHHICTMRTNYGSRCSVGPGPEIRQIDPIWYFCCVCLCKCDKCHNFMKKCRPIGLYIHTWRLMDGVLPSTRCTVTVMYCIMYWSL